MIFLFLIDLNNLLDRFIVVSLREKMNFGLDFVFDRKVINGFVICFFNGDLIVLICDRKYGV